MLDATQSPLFLNVAQSVLGRRWVVRDPAAERLGLAISQTHDLPDIVGRVLAARGVPVEEAAAYLEPTLRDLLPDPLSLRDMEAAADRLARAALKGERIAVFGDYDVDGASSSALIIRWLRMLGRDATLYIPDRIDEGYGPYVPAMEKLAEAHDLLIAVDCGTLAFEPIAAARAKGAEVIVADHHLAAETLPDCAAVVNPNRQDDESGQGHLCAAGVVFLLLIAANKALGTQGGAQGVQPVKQQDLLSLLDLVALATVADVAPLIGVNRALVRQGLKIMARRQNAGLTALADVGRLTTAPAAYHLGYVLGPRVNAGGRVGQADLGARLLISDSADEAQALAERLDAHNEERRAIEAAVLDAAQVQVEERGADGPLVWAAAEGWHPGVVGIVASRLKEKYNRPALVIGFEDGIGKGSGRSVEGVDLGRSVATCAREELFLKGGGHKMAAGVTVEQDKLPAAIERLSELLDKQGAAAMGPRDLRIDGAISPQGATLELVETLEAAGPFGPANPAPRFAIPSARVSWAKPAGEAHLRFTATDSGGGKLEAIAFRAFEGPLGAFLSNRDGRLVHLAGRIEIDDWGGRRRPKLRVEDAAEPT